MSAEMKTFEQLAALCSQPGFLHAYSYLCRRDCMLDIFGGLKSNDLITLDPQSKLIRTELSTLHGLIVKAGYNIDEVSSDIFLTVVSEAERLLAEIHDSLRMSCFNRFTEENLKLSMSEFFSEPDMIRESIYYGAEQAFDFQFASLAVQRYKNDGEWLSSHVGFNIDEAYSIYVAISDILNDNFTGLSDGNNKLEAKSYLEFYEISPKVISEKAKLDIDKVICFLNEFCTTSETGNALFNSIDDFNIVNAKPIIFIEGRYYLLVLASLAQSLYESPIFWMRDDKNYLNVAVEHRGKFTEEFAFQKLVSVFGEGNVFSNVDLFIKSSEKIGEIDVLAKFGSKYIVLQAKSKGMTIPSRKGQIELVKADFAKGFQNAYDQAIDCSNALMNLDVTLRDSSGNQIVLDEIPTKCYPVCLTSESYPSLTFQCRQYLEYKKQDNLNPPFIMDVFFLDMLTEFLDIPLFLLSYIDRRSSYIESIVASTEIVLLSMHLKRNLWLDENKFNMMHLEDDVASDLDAAFMVRRLGIPGERTPQGILQRYSSGFIGKLLFKIHRIAKDEIIDFGFTLLKCSGDFLDKLDGAVSKICYLALQDSKVHDFTVLFDKDGGGMTIHTREGSPEQRRERLLGHMKMRKYTEKQNKWTGIIVDPVSGMVCDICHINFPWVKDENMEQAINDLKLSPAKKFDNGEFKMKLKFKVGRNDKCLCGSGKKVKKCCGV
ncbi:SEC-C domain-containing protein [Aeromonas veronii]|nr:SEC-C domain-containing protein [Aeromonas veronii]